MKNLRKILSLVLALVMVVSLFAACGDKAEEPKKEDKEPKTEKVLTAEDHLLGKWNTVLEAEGMKIPLVFTFEKDGVAKIELTEEGYNEFVNQMVDMMFEDEGFNDLTAEQQEAVFVELGVANMADFKKMMADELSAGMPIEELQADFNMEGTWVLDGDNLTVEADGDTLVAETGLSKGEKTITFVDEINELNFELTKA